MEARTQFTFYESFFKALARIRKDADRAKAYDAICRFALYGEEANMDSLPDAAAVAYEIAVPVLEASRRKSKAGKKGGEAKAAEANGSKPEATGSKQEAKPKQEQEKEQVQVQVKDKEQMLYTPPPNGVGVYRQPTPSNGAVDAYMRAISSTPSTASMRELMDFEEKLGTELCCKAIDEALDANVKTWPYVKAVLKSYQDRGFKSLEDVQQAESQRMQRKSKPASQPAEINYDDLDRMFRAAQTGEEAGDG